MGISIGWWAIPTLLTLAVLAWAGMPRKSEKRSGDYDFAFWIPGAFRVAVAVIASLAAWLIYAVLT